MNIISKRDGQEVPFDSGKILHALKLANASVLTDDRLTQSECETIAEEASALCRNSTFILSVEDIQDFVENHIMALGKYELARNYIKYRYEHKLTRDSEDIDSRILSLVQHTNEDINQENSNKNSILNTVQRDYMAGEVSKGLTRRKLLPADIVAAHDAGIIHFHDADYFAQHMHNCCLVNLEDMLNNGTVISGTLIEKPHSFLTACNITTQIIAAAASGQYGGQTVSLAHLVPFIDISRQKIKRRLLDALNAADTQLSEEQCLTAAESLLRHEISSGVQTIQYQLVTLMTTNGQTPFVSIYIDFNEVKPHEMKDFELLVQEVFKQRIAGVKNEKGVCITPAFPKILYVLDECNAAPVSQFWELTKLAAACSSRRMTPDYISAKVMRSVKKGNVYPCMGCRSFLTVSDNCRNEDGSHKFYGRFNQGVVTLNLPDAALSSGGDFQKFWEILQERLKLCHRALRLRHERLLGTPSDVSPIHWQHGVIARLKKGEKIDSLLYNGYSTLSLGYGGLYECVLYMTGQSHTDPEAVDFAVKVMKCLNEACAKWKDEEKIDYSVYGTPMESTTYKFAKTLKKRFGVVPGITDHNYITNSYHVHVTEKINAFDKLKFEAPFQELSPGGAISYVEVPDMLDNLDAVLSLIQYIYDNIMYAELNCKMDYCEKCGYSGEIKIIEDSSGKFAWRCPNCGNTDQTTLYVTRRTCGYIGTQFWNHGRTEEIRDRVLHL